MVHDFMHIFEDHRDRLPSAIRALRAWSRLLSFQEGAGVPREAIAHIGIQMWLNGLLIEGIIVFLCFDAWLREQDWELLRGEDCVGDNHNQMAPLLGRRHRGEKVKTGSNQGVILQFDWVSDMISVLKKERPDDKLIFPLIQHRFRRIWWQTLHELKIETMGGRHTA